MNEDMSGTDFQRTNESNLQFSPADVLHNNHDDLNSGLGFNNDDGQMLRELDNKNKRYQGELEKIKQMIK